MAIHEIRVSSKEGDSPTAREVAYEADRSLAIKFSDVATSKVYYLEGITGEEARKLAATVLSDPITEHYTVNESPSDPQAIQREIAYKPGVMNPESASIIKATQDMGSPATAAESTRHIDFYGIDEKEVDKVVNSLLVNKTVQHVVTSPPDTLLFKSTPETTITVPIRQSSSQELMELSEGKLFLNTEEMNVVQQYFTELERDPTDIELEIIAARWSEHCGHKTFNAKVVVDGEEKTPLYKRIKTAAREHFGNKVISAFGDNSGVLRFYEGKAINGKVETHNSPSALEPYGGAMTGSGGVFRDIMGTGKGAKTIISTDMFCFAPPNLDKSLLPHGTLHPDYIQRRVIEGVRDYGNRMGIPTANGSTHYDDDFRAKPMVMVGAYGILPESEAQKGTPLVGDQVVIIGGKTGRDGIHGATFSSGEMTNETVELNSNAVQIGNAIEEKRMSDALLIARDRGLIRAMTDCGAAGFSSAIGEIAEDTGATVDISKAPLKYPGLAPWEIWLSESQERMVAAIAPEDTKEFLEICKLYNVEAAVLGEFDGSNTLTINYAEQNVAELDYDFLENGLPQRTMYAHWEQDQINEAKPETPSSEAEWTNRVKQVLAHGNVCSKEPVVQQYDHGVQGGNIVSPFGGATQSGPNDALVVRPMLNKPYGVVVSHGMNPILNKINPYDGTVWAITEAAANYVSAGGQLAEAAAVGNYVWPFPDEEAMGSLDKSVDAAVDMMHALKLPVISGKDSLSSTYRNNETGEVIKIPPVYTMSIFGPIPDVNKTMTTEIKHPGDSLLYLVGSPSKDMGGSSYYDVANGEGGEVPTINTELLPKTLKNVEEAIASDNVLACHDVSEGGLVTAVAEMCFGSNCGATIQIPAEPSAETFLFNETAGCFIVELPTEQAAKTLFKDTPAIKIGTTSRKPTLTVQQNNDTKLFATEVSSLKQSWQSPMQEVFHS